MGTDPIFLIWSKPGTALAINNAWSLDLEASID
jgi:hypothetical protein